MKKQSGFTLIELVVVIIILGILAVVAAPKFINLTSDAREAALKGVSGSIKGANAMVYAKAQVAGQTGETGTINLDGITDTSAKAASTPTAEQFGLVYGYIPATKEALQLALDLDDSEWQIANNAGTDTAVAAGSINIKQTDAPAQCYVTYTQATADKAPVVTVKESGC